MKEIEELPEVERILEIPISYEEKGKEIGKKEVAMEMLRKGLDINLIAEVTYLDKEEIKNNLMISGNNLNSMMKIWTPMILMRNISDITNQLKTTREVRNS